MRRHSAFPLPHLFFLSLFIKALCNIPSVFKGRRLTRPKSPQALPVDTNQHTISPHDLISSSLDEHQSKRCTPNIPDPHQSYLLPNTDAGQSRLSHPRNHLNTRKPRCWRSTPRCSVSKPNDVARSLLATVHNSIPRNRTDTQFLHHIYYKIIHTTEF